MAKKPEPPIAVSVVDNRAAPDVFADRVAGAFLNNGIVHITFASRRCDYSQTPNQFSDVVIGTLAIPFAAAENMVQFLGEFLERMKTQEMNPPSDTPRTLQ